MAEGRSWRAASGAWLGIGTAPGALVLGAQVGGRHGGALPAVVLVAGGAVMAALLAAQGRLGLLPPDGENAGMTDLAPRYLPPIAERAFTALLAAAMVGWFGFNVGLGGAAAAALAGLPDAAGVLLLTVPMVAVLIAGGGRWNAVAVATTLTAVALIGIVAARLPPPSSPVSLARDGPPSLLAADLAGYIGYVSVFAVRAPDFTVGLRRRRDLAACVALLVGPALAASVVGAGVAAASGSTDVVAVLAGPDGLPAANLFVAASVIAPTLAAVHSGVFAVQRFMPTPQPPNATTHNPPAHNPTTPDTAAHHATAPDEATNNAPPPDAAAHDAVTHGTAAHDAATNNATAPDATAPGAPERGALGRDAPEHDAVAHDAAAHQVTVHDAAAPDAVARGAPERGATMHDATAYRATVHDAAARDAVGRGAPAPDVVARDVSLRDAVVRGLGACDSAVRGVPLRGSRARGLGGTVGLGRWGRVVAVLVIAVPGAVLAALRVDRMLLDWLTVLAAALPALVPPMAAEAARRSSRSRRRCRGPSRRGRGRAPPTPGSSRRR
ncbi:hypothetical protein, partial [Actinomadura fibrosa]|uniref:hypothetical protein n=1 Tax=Actinomadura fibrosa TaxID=111802 RepID=UPI0010418920